MKKQGDRFVDLCFYQHGISAGERRCVRTVPIKIRRYCLDFTWQKQINNAPPTKWCSVGAFYLARIPKSCVWSPSLWWVLQLMWKWLRLTVRSFTLVFLWKCFCLPKLLVRETRRYNQKAVLGEWRSAQRSSWWRSHCSHSMWTVCMFITIKAHISVNSANFSYGEIVGHIFVDWRRTTMTLLIHGNTCMTSNSWIFIGR